MSPLQYFRAWSCPVKLLFFLTMIILMSLACMELLVVWNTPQPTVLAATLTASPIPTPTSTLPATLSPTPVVVVISPTPPTLYTPPLITPSGPPPASPTAEQSVANIYTGLTLVSPSPEMKFPVNIQAVEFQWKWDAKPQCGAPPNAYGFLIQIWRKDDGTPLGAMDAATDRLYIFCNPDTGIYNYKLNDLRDAPGVGRRELGVGKFYWNVAYVELNPFKIISQSAPNTFEITLEYTGPKDPHGFDLNCSDFASWGEAQAIFLAAGGPEQDLHRLDPDTNGYACDQLR